MKTIVLKHGPRLLIQLSSFKHYDPATDEILKVRSVIFSSFIFVVQAKSFLHFGKEKRSCVAAKLYTVRKQSASQGFLNNSVFST